MSEKIVFNGREYDGVDAMPADVRRQYEDVLRIIREEASGKLDSLLGGDSGQKVFKVTTTVHRRIVVNGKEYQSLKDLPSEVRRAFEGAIAEARADAPADTSIQPPRGALEPPRLAEDQPRGVWGRIATLLVLAALAALWLFRKSLLGH